MFKTWRLIHRTASILLALMALAHAGIAFIALGAWGPSTAWFLGTGLGLLFLAVMNFAHIGCGPCDMPTAPPVKWANWVALIFAIATAAVVPQPQVIVVTILLAMMTIAGHWTLLGPGAHGHDDEHRGNEVAH